MNSVSDSCRSPKALDLTTTTSSRALAGMLAAFAEFERDILRDRVKAGNRSGAPGRQTPRTTPDRAAKRRSDSCASQRPRRQHRDRQARERQPNLGPAFTRAVAAQMAPGGTSVG
jgi:DNA invertase Pin-like site-specific DNA recombinase